MTIDLLKYNRWYPFFMLFRGSLRLNIHQLLCNNNLVFGSIKKKNDFSLRFDAHNYEQMISLHSPDA